jgi:serine/threonine-protein kinase
LKRHSLTDAVSRLSSALADRYVIERELGAGGMATVYLAQDVRHDRKVALKVLRPELSAILGAERFLHEIKTTANLQHPHILSLFDSGEADGLVFYVMPYVEGESLRDRLNREKQLPVDEAVRIAREVADALEYAHQKGIVHRDIKPENILLHGGHAMVADFGIALAASRSEGGTRMTETGMSLGTPHYMSPEQSMGEREITPKADIYALGCVLYEMLTAEPPFVGATAQAIIARVVTEEPRSLTLQRKTIPPHVEAAVLTALAKLPADRFGSAAEFAAALSETGYRIPGHRGAAAQKQHAVWPSGRLAVLPWALAALALAVAGWAMLRSRPAGLAAVTRLPISLPDSAPLRTQFGILFALSDDGSQIVYVGPGQGDVDLWTRPLNSLAATRIPGTSGGDSPFLSPAGDVVAFYRNTPNALFTVSLRGGPRQTIASDSMVPTGGDFGPDGAIYFTRRGGIRRLPRGGQVVEQVTTVDTARGENAHAWVDVLPNGRGALFTIVRTRTDEYDIAAVNFASHEVKVLTRGIFARYAPSGHLLYATADGGLFALAFDQRALTTSGAVIPVVADVARGSPGAAHFAISATGTLLYGRALGGATGDRIEWVDRSGRSEAIDTSLSGALVDVALSPDGRRLAVTRNDNDGRNVWVKELDHGPMSRLSLSAPPNISVGWTPDGRSVLYVTQAAGGQRAVVVRRADGSAPAESLLAGPRDIISAAESRDGQWIVYTNAGGLSTGRDVFARRLRGDTTLVAIAAGPAREESPRLSPDGRWVAYLSNESGRSEVYVRPFPNTAASRTQVSVDGGYEPLWSPNGRELFYSNEDGTLFVARVESSPAFRVVARNRLFDRTPYNYNSDGALAYDIAPDGRHFIMMREGQVSAMQLILVLNFFADLALAGR